VKIQIVHIKPANSPHAEGLREVAETLFYAALALGHDVNLAHNVLDAKRLNIVVGWHLLAPATLHRYVLGHSVVLYNLEQLAATGLADRFAAASWSCALWDYSAHNIAALRGCDVKETPLCVPLGHVPEMTQITHGEPMTDVLFYGSLNARRNAVLADLRKRGLEVSHLFGVYGRRRDAEIATAKVVLNMHNYDTQIFEVVRCSYLWSNKVAVVSECNGDTDYPGAARFVPYDDLVEACVALVNDPVERARQAQAGFDIWGQVSMADHLRNALRTV
jgi:hypothetical protein